MIVISGSLSLADTAAAGGGIVTADNPVIGYEQRVTAANISATTTAAATAAASYAAANMANTSTNLRWEGAPSSPPEDDYITLALATTELVDYVGIARHNFGTQQIPVSLEVYNGDLSPPAWEEVISDFIPADDSPIVMRFTPQAISSCRIRLQPGDGAPSAAVVYAGKLLVLQRRIYVGHTPIPMGTTSRVINGRSEDGEFLGRIVLAQKNATSFEMANLTPSWFRAYMWPWIKDAVENPFFFAWRPGSYPAEVGFAWLIGDPQPSNTRNNGMMSCTFEMEGIA